MDNISIVPDMWLIEVFQLEWLDFRAVKYESITKK